MNKVLAAAVCLGLGSVSVAPASAAGCLSGAAVGGVAGHVAGRHGFLGAAIGCAVGHHKGVMDRRARRAAYQQQSQPVRTQTPTTAPQQQIAR